MNKENSGISTSQSDRWYENYWKRFNARENIIKTIRPKCLFWYWSETLNEVEDMIFNKSKGLSRILDFGAGDCRLKVKFQAAGYKGNYDTLDVSKEHRHEYSSISEVSSLYDAIFCFEVIEHMTLNEYVNLMEEFDRILRPGGLLAISTPNPACVISMWSQDAGHKQQYPLPDLAADFVIHGYAIEAFRTRFSERPKNFRDRVRFFIQKLLCYLLGVDYANGIVVIGNKPVG